MKELIEYSKLSNWAPEGGDQLRLYELAVAGASREGAREVLDISNNHFNVIYKKLKDNFAQSLLTETPNGIPKTAMLRHDVRKQYTTAMFLLRTDKKTAGVPLARAAIRKAEKYGMYPIALDLSRELLRHYGPGKADKKLYNYYSEKQKFFYDEIDAELRAESLFFDLGYALKKNLPIDNFVNKLNSLNNVNAKSYSFHYMKWLSKVIYLQAKGKEQEMLEACTSALKFFMPFKDLPYVVRFSFYYRAISILIAHRDFQQAEVLINRCLQVTAIGRHNWQIIMFRKALLGFYSHKYSITFAAYNRLNKIPQKHLSEDTKERWLIIEAYLALFDFELPKKFRLRRFLNSVPISNADKAGQNINIIILELMHLLKANKLRDFDDRCDQLDKYINQHLKGKKQQRSVNFLRMLQSIQRGGYHKVAAQRKAQSYLVNLEKTSPNISANAVEIVPFEKLWEMAMKWL